MKFIQIAVDIGPEAMKVAAALLNNGTKKNLSVLDSSRDMQVFDPFFLALHARKRGSKICTCK